uniref:Uncharacterized protein n=1 Tax=Mycena chlorophos TaxID=658473 RepID=A0ABQ0LIG2_MYCCL|nr:predicted protein [Mycena chlorophos]
MGARFVTTRTWSCSQKRANEKEGPILLHVCKRLQILGTTTLESADDAPVPVVRLVLERLCRPDLDLVSGTLPFLSPPKFSAAPTPHFAPFIVNPTPTVSAFPTMSFLTPAVVVLVAALRVHAAAGALAPRQSSTLASHYYGNFSFPPAGFVLDKALDINDVNPGDVEYRSEIGAGNRDLNDRSLLDKHVADCPASIAAFFAPRCSYHESAANPRSCRTGEPNCTYDNSGDICSCDIITQAGEGLPSSERGFTAASRTKALGPGEAPVSFLTWSRLLQIFLLLGLVHMLTPHRDILVDDFPHGPSHPLYAF